MLNTPPGPTLLGVDVIWVGTILAALATMAVLFAVYTAVTIRDPMQKRVKALNERREHLVFMLWGSYAQRKGSIIDRDRHLVLSSAHPSPLSAYRGFIGNGHFSAANRYLAQHGKRAIDWRLPDPAH